MRKGTAILVITIVILAIGMALVHYKGNNNGTYSPTSNSKELISYGEKQIGHPHSTSETPIVVHYETTKTSNEYTTVYKTYTVYAAFPKSYKMVKIDIPITTSNIDCIHYYYSYNNNTVSEKEIVNAPIYISSGVTSTGHIWNTFFETSAIKKGDSYYATYPDFRRQSFTGQYAQSIYSQVYSHVQDIWTGIHWGADFTIYPKNFPGYIVIHPNERDIKVFESNTIRAVFKTGYAVITEPIKLSALSTETYIVPIGTYHAELWIDMIPVYGTTARYVATRTYVYSSNKLIYING